MWIFIIIAVFLVGSVVAFIIDSDRIESGRMVRRESAQCRL